MAKVELTPGLASLSGKLNDDYYFRTDKGITYLCSMPKRSKKPPTAAQLSQQERFRRAQRAARTALEDPELHAFFEKQWREQKGRHISKTLRGFIFSQLYRKEAPA